MKKFDLTWGESVVVRHRFLEHTRGIPIEFGLKELSEMDYTPFNGDLKLIDETHKVILRQTGKRYKHVFLTNGASGGCTIALRAYNKLGFDTVATHVGPYFPLYPLMAQAADLRHIHFEEEMNTWLRETVFLLDSPHNPTGKHQTIPGWAYECPVIWDAVYHNWAYCHILPEPPKHDVMVGSYSKLTGLNGLRLGWIATNDDLLADEIGKLIAPEYCGLSRPSKMILTTLLDQFNRDPEHYWTAFEHSSRYWLDLNRGTWSKLEKYFGNTPVPVNGMFYYAQLDAACKRLLDKAGVMYQVGSKCGTTDDFGRFNIGQDPHIINGAVKSILNEDKI